MSETVIKVENLGKRYRICEHQPYKTFREVLSKASKAPFQRFKKALSKELKAKPDSQLSALSSPLSLPFNTLWALKNVSFEVKQGEVVGIIGRNGAGKSTLLKILSKITEPTEGRVELKGRVGSLLEVGTGFHPELTGHENIYLYGAILGMDRREVTHKFDEIVAFAELEKFLDTPVKRYSSGMYMRLAFAVAAHLEPEILLVDEVLAVGDAAFQKKCLGKMGNISKEGRTVFFVSHNMNAIEQFCSRCILLRNGNKGGDTKEVHSLINSYLFGPQSSDTKMEWKNKSDSYQNPWFQPLRFLISDAKGSPLFSPIRNNDEAWVSIEGIVQQIDPSLQIGYALYSEDGNLLYWSCYTDMQEKEWLRIERGTLRLRSKLPFRLLNEGGYRSELLVSLYYREWLVEPGNNAPSILFTIKGGLSDSPYWMIRRPGILAPLIKWEEI